MIRVLKTEVERNSKILLYIYIYQFISEGDSAKY